MADGTGADIGLSHRAHLNGGLHPDLHALLLQHIGHSQGVDGGGQHAHVVGTDPDHLVAAVLDAAPEVAAADNDADLTALLAAFLDHVADRADHIKVQTEMLVARKGLAADLDQYALVFLCFHAPHSSCYFPKL